VANFSRETKRRVYVRRSRWTSRGVQTLERIRKVRVATAGVGNRSVWLSTKTAAPVSRHRYAPHVRPLRTVLDSCVLFRRTLSPATCTSPEYRETVPYVILVARLRNEIGRPFTHSRRFTRLRPRVLGAVSFRYVNDTVTVSA